MLFSDTRVLSHKRLDALPRVSCKPSKISATSSAALLSVQPCRDVHTPKLLEQQLRSIRKVDLRNFVLVVTILALESILLQLGDDRHQTADVADVYPERV